MNSPRFRSLDRQRGMTLVEVLVTLVLISVGLLGVAALQMTTLRSNQEAYVRSQASALAGDILDRMRTNQAGVLKGEYAVDGAARDPNGTGTAGTTAADDLTAWRKAIAEILPGAPTGSVELKGRVVTVTITWAERADFATATAADAFTTFKTATEI